MTRILWNPEVRSFEDAIIKIMPPELSTVGGLFGGNLLEDKKKKEQELQQAESKLEEAEKQKETTEEQQEAVEENTKEQPPEATSGAEITGFKGGEQVANPNEQPGTIPAEIAVLLARCTRFCSSTTCGIWVCAM